jgi:iron complex transport system substrate-binding protein
MDGDDSTRRRVIATLGTLGAGALAGCASGTERESESTTTSTDTETTDESTTSGESTTTDDTETSTETDDGSYTVSMAPVADVTFEETPESWATYFPGYADMGVALGESDGLTGIGFASRYYTSYYDELDGVSVATDGLTQFVGDGGIDKEIFYELDNDVHLTDPEWLVNNAFFGLERKDVDAVASDVGPFVGNTIFRRTDGWHDYRYYTMYEAFEKVAQVFGKEDRYAAFESFHDDVLADVQSSLPAESDRPNGLLCFAGGDEPESFSPYRITDLGTNKKHFRDLGVGDALEGSDVEGLSSENRSKIDYETMLQVDPEMLFVRGHETKTEAEFQDTVVSFMENHSVASDLTAVENGDVYRGGPIYQGPIQNLFLTERFAALLYPDAFGEELFDRDELAAIVTGDV